MPNDQIQHGSYHQYYDFRSQDSRPEHLKQCLLRCLDQLACHGNGDLHMLDIGCNSGKLTNSVLAVARSVYKDAGSIKMLGVDIGPELIKEATDVYRTPGLEFACADVSAIALDQPVDNAVEDYMKRNELDQFDFVFCFSVLMYIHLNHGDEGLSGVLDYVCSKTKVLVLELQSWKKYRDHVRKMRREGEGYYRHYSFLQWKGNSGKLEQYINDYVISRGFSIVSDERDVNEFNRNIVIFSKSSNSEFRTVSSK